MPDGIDKLTSLHTLEGVSVTESSVENIKGLCKLTNLRKLHISSREVPQHKEEANIRMNALHSSICMIATNLRTLTFEGWVTVPNVRGWSSSVFPPVNHIQELDLLSCKFERCPEWFGQLHHLYKLTIKVRKVADAFGILAKLTSLAYFKLVNEYLSEDESENKESVVIPGSGAFESLKHLIFYCKMAKLSFEPGAMPKLEKLGIEFRYNMKRRFLPVGIMHLPAGTLKEISLYAPSWENIRTLMPMLMKPFKQQHPTADLHIYIDGDEQDYSSEEDVYSANDEEDSEEDYYTEEDDDTSRTSSPSG